jgi:hypothetical protein
MLRFVRLEPSHTMTRMIGDRTLVPVERTHPTIGACHQKQHITLRSSTVVEAVEIVRAVICGICSEMSHRLPDGAAQLKT